MNVPPMPPEAAPWQAVQAIGRETIAFFWQRCWEMGVEVGKAIANVDYARGIAHASMCWLAIYLVVFGVSAIVSKKSR